MNKIYKNFFEDASYSQLNLDNVQKSQYIWFLQLTSFVARLESAINNTLANTCPEVQKRNRVTHTERKRKTSSCEMDKTVN